MSLRKQFETLYVFMPQYKLFTVYQAVTTGFISLLPTLTTSPFQP